MAISVDDIQVAGDGGDGMNPSVYDPQEKETDIFQYADNALLAAKAYCDSAIQAAISSAWTNSY